MNFFDVLRVHSGSSGGSNCDSADAVGRWPNQNPIGIRRKDRRQKRRRCRRWGRIGWPQGSSFIHGAFTRYPRKANLLLSLLLFHRPLSSSGQPLVPPYIILLSFGMDWDQPDIISSSRIHFRARLTAPSRPHRFRATIHLA